MTPKSSRFWQKREKRSLVDAKMEAERLLRKLGENNLSPSARSLHERRLSAALRECGPCRATWFEGRAFIEIAHRMVRKAAAVVGIAAPSPVATPPNARRTVGYSRRIA
jgi:hypothetical protein